MIVVYSFMIQQSGDDADDDELDDDNNYEKEEEEKDDYWIWLLCIILWFNKMVISHPPGLPISRPPVDDRRKGACWYGAHQWGKNS